MPLPLPTWNKGEPLSADKLRMLTEHVRSSSRAPIWPGFRNDNKHFRKRPLCIEFEFKVEIRTDPDDLQMKYPAWRQGRILGYEEETLVGTSEWTFLRTWQAGDEVEFYLNYTTLENGVVKEAEMELEARHQVIHQPAGTPGKYSLKIATVDKNRDIVQYWLGPVVHHWIALRNSDDRWGPPWDGEEGHSAVPGVGHVLHKRDGQSWTARKLVAGQNVGIYENEHSILISAAGGGSGLDISIVPGPGIDAERSDSTAADGTHIIRYDIKGRLSQYENWQKPAEQGDITAVHIAINPSLNPVPLCYPCIIDGDIQLSIVPGPITKVAAGENVTVTEKHTDSPEGWPIVTYTVSAKSGDSVSIVPGPGIAIDDITGGAPGPRVLRISKDIALHGHSGINVTEQVLGNHVDYHIGLDPSAISIVPGPVGDSERPHEARTESGMIANGWVKVNGGFQDPSGHAHPCFMAVKNNKLYFAMLDPLAY